MYFSGEGSIGIYRDSETKCILVKVRVCKQCNGIDVEQTQGGIYVWKND